MFHVIDDEEARALVGRAEAIEIVDIAYRAAAAGQAAVSQPSALFLRGKPEADTHFKIKGAVLDALNVAGFRIIADGPHTVDGANTYLYVADAETGRPIGMVSESWLHRLRTASTGLVTCRALRPAGIRTIALIGTGRIAEEFILSCHLVLPQVEIVVASRSTARARAAAERWKALTPLRLRAAEIKDALSVADTVVTLSDAAERLFGPADLRAGALICAMGGRYEFDCDVLEACDVFVVDEIDFVCSIGSGSHWIASGQTTRSELERRLDASIGDVLSGARSVPVDRPTLAIIQGMAICDLAIAKTVLDRAIAKA